MLFKWISEAVVLKLCFAAITESALSRCSMISNAFELSRDGYLVCTGVDGGGVPSLGEL